LTLANNSESLTLSFGNWYLNVPCVGTSVKTVSGHKDVNKDVNLSKQLGKKGEERKLGKKKIR